MLGAPGTLTLHGISESEDNIPEPEDTRPGAASDPDHVDRVIAQWSNVRPDLDLRPVALIARIGRATAYIDAGVNARLAELGLTRGTWDVLASLRRGGPPYRLSPTQLYLELMRTSGAMTHRLNGLERAGLIRRVPDPQDGRGILVELTHKGVTTADQVAPQHLANEQALVASLSREERETLSSLLRKLLSNFEREQPVPPPTGVGGRHRPSRRGPKRD